MEIDTGKIVPVDYDKDKVEKVLVVNREEHKNVFQEKKIEENVCTDEKEKKNQEEQEKLKKMHKIETKIDHIFMNIMAIVMCLVSGSFFVKELINPARTSGDNEKLLMSGIMFLVWALLIWLLNKGGEILFDKVLSLIAKVKERQSRRKKHTITDLNSALHCMSQKNGVVIWDTLWSVAILFMAICSILGDINPVIIGSIIFLLVMLFGGHYIGNYIWRCHRYEKRILKHTKTYLDILDEEAYLSSINKSIQRGVLGYTDLWMMTDEYIIGRLSDVRFVVVAIPREIVEHCVFFDWKRIASEEIPIGILQCQLKSGKNVDFEIGRGKISNQVLRILNEQGIHWEMRDMKYTL